MAFRGSLLPSNATPWMRAVEAASAERRPLDVDAVRRVWDPWTCPEDLLLFAAHAHGVRLWEETWPVTRKRQMIAQAIELRRLEGSLAGMRRMLGFVDAEITRVFRPPMRIFSGPSLTKDQREAWLAGLPQIRTWRTSEPGTAGRRVFAGGQRYRSFLVGRFTQPSSAPERRRRRARWIVDGLETDATVIPFEGYFRILIPSRLPRSVLAGSVVRSGRFWLPSTAASRIVTVAPRVTGETWRATVGPQLEPVTAEPERIRQFGKEGRGVFTGRVVGAGRFFIPSTAVLRFFDRYAVHDGSKVNRRPSIQFMGVGRYGMPPHTAELVVKVRGTWSPYAAGRGLIIPRGRFWLRHDPGPMQRVRRAAVAAKRASDVVLVNSRSEPGFIAGELFVADVNQYIV